MNVIINTLNIIKWTVLIWFILFLFSMFTPAEAAEVNFSWNEPTQRENGEVLAPEEIGGYEVRYTEAVSGEQSSVVLERQGSAITSYAMELPDGDYTFEVAAFDTNGLYSEFITISQPINTPSAPGGVQNLGVDVSFILSDRIAECEASVNCKVK